MPLAAVYSRGLMIVFDVGGQQLYGGRERSVRAVPRERLELGARKGYPLRRPKGQADQCGYLARRPAQFLHRHFEASAQA